MRCNAQPSNRRSRLAILTLMNERIRKLTEQASLLPPVERAALVEGILQSLDATDPNLDQLWAEEAQDRLAAYRRGELEALDFDETLAKYAQPLMNVRLLGPAAAELDEAVEWYAAKRRASSGG